MSYRHRAQTGRSRAGRRAVLLCCCLPLLFGCAVEPPIPLEKDPRYVELPLADTAQIASQLAVVVTASSPTTPSSLWPALPSTPGTSVDTTNTDLEPREYAWSPPQHDLPATQRRLATLLSWALTGGDPLVELSTEASSAQAPGLRGRLRTAALSEGAELLVSMELSDCRVAWVGRDGLWWLSNFLLFYGPGIYPVVLIPDEVYEVSLRARVSVVHVGSGLSLASRTFLATHQRSLNDAQRGWSLTGLLFLYPYTLDKGDFEHVLEALLPHARKELERQALTWLREELPQCLAREEVQALPSGSLAGRWIRKHDGSVFEVTDDGGHVRGTLVGREDVFASYRFDVSRKSSGVLKGQARMALVDSPKKVLRTAWELRLSGDDLSATVEWVDLDDDGKVVGRGTEEQAFVRAPLKAQAKAGERRAARRALPASSRRRSARHGR